MDQFVCVRLSRAETLDLSLFQFDPDLSFAVFFMSADQTIYGRYGSRSDFYDADRDVSIEGLCKAMERALSWHSELSEIKPALDGKRGPKPMYPTLADFPSSRKGGGYSRSLGVGGSRCTHCHDLRTAEQMAYRASGDPMPDHVLFSWPMPDVLGLHLDPREIAKVDQVSTDSIAQQSGFQVGDQIESFEGQPILSIADVQWVLQNAPDKGSLVVDVRRGDAVRHLQIDLPTGWRRHVDISWRITTSELRRRIINGVSYRDLSAADRASLGLADNVVALRAARGVSRSTGAIRRGDVVVAVDGSQDYRNEGGLIAYFVQKKDLGDEVTLTLLRDGERLDVEILVEQ